MTIIYNNIQDFHSLIKILILKVLVYIVFVLIFANFSWTLYLLHTILYVYIRCANCF